MIGLLNAAPPVVFTFTIKELWTGVLGICGGITAVSAAIAVIVKAVNKAKEPDKKQNEQIETHGKELEEVNRKLKNDKEVLDLYRSKILALEEHQKEQDILLESHSSKIAGIEQRLSRSEHGSNAMMKALLALLSHGLDGNSIDQMREAKTEIEDYLIKGQNLNE